MTASQVDFVVAFLGVTYARAVAAPLNAAYKQVGPVDQRVGHAAGTLTGACPPPGDGRH